MSIFNPSRILQNFSPHNQDSISRCVQESVGTFYLVLTVCLVQYDISQRDFVCTGVAPGLAIGAVVMILIFMGGHISGGHYNPAVTFGVWCSGRDKITGEHVLLYWTSQFLGSFMAALFSWALTGSTSPTLANVTPGQACIVEAFYTFFLVLTVLSVATARTQQGNSYYGLAIGFAVLSGVLVVGPITGGVFNPAVAFGPILANLMRGNHGRSSPVWIYYIGPMFGGILASIAFRITHSGEYIPNEIVIANQLQQEQLQEHQQRSDAEADQVELGVGRNVNQNQSKEM